MLRLVGFPIIYRLLSISGGCLGCLPLTSMVGREVGVNKSVVSMFDLIF